MDIRAVADAVRPHHLVFAGRGLIPNFYDVIVFILIAGVCGDRPRRARDERVIKDLDVAAITLDPRNLPNMRCARPCACSLQSRCRCCSLSWSRPLAAKSRKAELVIVPALDILQSVPVLGFLTFTVTFFLGCFPATSSVPNARRSLRFHGPGLNATFSFYQSLRTVPSDLDECCRHFQLSPGCASGGWRFRSPPPA
jgi:NitT/TauT family transport system permease protein